ncbi:uncharacterized protein LY89DRAFT_666976 [Mollisia scopiformis]|uniref:Uncharacterized protein n=1 Tax=Mollisia scopiformis TaxID=149040 RepID=A0A194XJ57_MOLSC|nr:uncharacterized protein LY89DRAFT_666976 [Mollisia scopiformis]KUJ20156.1 hypothetical protein LY89DRAFT_666976 [Mollisia scopiformis]
MTVESSEPETTRRILTKRVFPAHTKEWFQQLPREMQRKYASEQIQADVGRQCVDSGISHQEHESRLDPGSYTKPPTRWELEGSISEAMLDIEGLALEDPETGIMHMVSRGSIGPRASTRLPNNLLTFPLECGRVLREVSKLDLLVDQFAQSLVCASGITVSPLEQRTLARLEALDSESYDGHLSLMSALRYLCKATPTTDLRARIRQCAIESLTFEDVFRACTSIILMDLIFQGSPPEMLALRDTLERAHPASSNPRPLLIEQCIEDYFGPLLSLPSFQHSITSSAPALGLSLYSKLKPLIVLLGDEIDPDIERLCHRDCFEICKAACLLNAEFKVKPTSPVELYTVLSGDEVKGYYVDNSAEDDKVGIMLMFGVKAAGNSDMPLIYSKAKVATSSTEK